MKRRGFARAVAAGVAVAALPGVAQPGRGTGAARATFVTQSMLTVDDRVIG
ncbi:hypothetical protein [Ramlibacter tataouinensis]|uniref:hypothetical protein n=1 Tax=Ramlibacter tataouinensis TaxID=94132 RepID=UPI0002F0CBAF|nr:hypothetical protein [Ramlibacter tataouinensis]